MMDRLSVCAGSNPVVTAEGRQLAARCDVGVAASLSSSLARVRFPSASLFWPGVMWVLQPGPQPGRRGFDSRPGHCQHDPVVQWRRRLDDTQENGSSILPGITCTNGLLVQWEDTWFAPR